MTAPPLSVLPDAIEAQIGADAETLVLLAGSDRPMTLVRERAQDVTLRLRLPEDSVRVLYDLSLAGVIPFPGPMTDAVPPGPEIENGAWDVHVQMDTRMLVLLAAGPWAWHLTRQAPCWGCWSQGGALVRHHDDEHAVVRMAARDARQLSTRLAVRGLWHAVTVAGDWDTEVFLPSVPDADPPVRVVG